jgi:hypothetical protein
MEQLRDVVDLGSKFFIELLDDVIRVSSFDLGLFSKIRGDNYESFRDIVANAEHLDHFHVYEKQEQNQESGRALELHTDQGLFIAIVPSIKVAAGGKVDKDEDSFMVALKNGVMANVKLPAQGNVLLFMVGDGSNYLKRHSHYPLRAVPHALSLKPSEAKTVRAWFGRMFFAPNDALISEQGDTFASIIGTVAEARRLNQEFPSLSCSQSTPTTRLLEDPSGHNCSAGTAYCWMSCRAITGDCADEEAICQNSVTGAIWVDCPTCHDMNARNVCPTDAPTASPTTSPTVFSDANIPGATGGPTVISDANLFGHHILVINLGFVLALMILA